MSLHRGCLNYLFARDRSLQCHVLRSSSSACASSSPQLHLPVRRLQPSGPSTVLSVSSTHSHPRSHQLADVARTQSAHSLLSSPLLFPHPLSSSSLCALPLCPAALLPAETEERRGGGDGPDSWPAGQAQEEGEVGHGDVSPCRGAGCLAWHCLAVSLHLPACLALKHMCPASRDILPCRQAVCRNLSARWCGLTSVTKSVRLVPSQACRAMLVWPSTSEARGSRTACLCAAPLCVCLSLRSLAPSLACMGAHRHVCACSPAC